MRIPLQGAVLLETSYISLDDCFAAIKIVGFIITDFIPVA